MPAPFSLSRLLRGAAPLAAASALLAACAGGPPTATPEECANADWYAMGVADGRQGAAVTAINDEVIACRPHNIEPDLAEYRRGRLEGLETFCQPASIVDAALRGGSDVYVCPDPSPALIEASETAFTFRQAAARYQQVRQSVEQLQQQDQAAAQEIQRLQSAFQQTADANQRRQIQARAQQIQQQRQQIQQQLEQVGPQIREEQRTYERAEQEFTRYARSIGYQLPSQ